MTDSFKALVLTQVRGKTEPHIRQFSVDDLPDGDVPGVLAENCLPALWTLFTR